jgi:hypothetical protein
LPWVPRDLWSIGCNCPQQILHGVFFGGYDPGGSPDGERHVLERTVHAIAERARYAYSVVEEAHEVDPRDESGLVAAAKRLRMELLQTKAELERELGRLVLHCRHEVLPYRSV